jgi:hypothetical protein
VTTASKQAAQPPTTRELLAPHDRDITAGLLWRRRHPEHGGSP